MTSLVAGFSVAEKQVGSHIALSILELFCLPNPLACLASGRRVCPAC